MSNTKIFIGTLKTSINNLSKGERIYIDKHSFDCGWYWGFGYIGNAHCHTHFDRTFLKDSDVLMPSEMFIRPKHTDAQWWEILDLFKQAYALKSVAEVYKYGGHYTSDTIHTITSDQKAEMINNDLEKVLDKVWCKLLLED